MLKLVFPFFSLLLLSSCGGLLHPGLISTPHLNEKGDVQASLQVLAQDELLGSQGHLAYALSDGWGIMGGYGLLSSKSTVVPSDRDFIGFYELSAIRMFGSTPSRIFNSTNVQLGFGQSLHSIINRTPLGLSFRQNQFFLQGNSRHELSNEVAMQFGLRISANSLNGLTQSGLREVVYLQAQEVFAMATPIVQVESYVGPFTFTCTLQPSYVLNQRYVRLPANPLNLGVRWNLK